LPPAVVTPFAGVVHVRLALLEQLAVASEGVDPFRARHVSLNFFLDPLLAVGPLDQDPFFLEQSLVIGDELRQSLERRRGLQDELFHELGSEAWASASRGAQRLGARRRLPHQASLNTTGRQRQAPNRRIVQQWPTALPRSGVTA